MKRLFGILLVTLFLAITGSQAQQKAIVETPKPIAPIAFPEPESAQLKASVEEYNQQVAALNAQYQQRWKLIIQHAALRAKLPVEQADTLIVNPTLDAKGNVTGYVWETPKVELPKP